MVEYPSAIFRGHVLLDFAIVVAAYAIGLFLAVIVALRLPRIMRWLDPPRVGEMRDVLPKAEALLKYGEDEASLTISRELPIRTPIEVLALVKYLTESGAHGLECIFSAQLGSKNFGSYPDTGDRSKLMIFLTEHRVSMREFTSPPEAHWSDSFHMIRLDFTHDCAAAIRFAEFFFDDMLGLPRRPYFWTLKGTALGNRLIGVPVLTLPKRQIADAIDESQRKWQPWRRRRDKPRAELIDLQLVLVPLLGLAGLAYSLALATPSWPAVQVGWLGAEIGIEIFDLLFILTFIWGAMGRVILRSPRGIRWLLGRPLTLLMRGFHRIMCFALSLEIPATGGRYDGF